MRSRHRQCNLKRTPGRKLDNQPRSHRWQHGNNDNIRSCTSHLQLYRNQCCRLYFAAFGKCCDQCPAGHPGITHNRSGSHNATHMRSRHRQCNFKRTPGRKLDDQPRSHRWQHGHNNNIRSCTRHLQLHRDQCRRLYFAAFGKRCDQCPAGHPGMHPQ